jgi:murein DD-endopeptidase MepM/ murein hydrolase activator NlpD
VRAIGHGAVTLAGTQGGYGRVVTIRHANGFVSLYGHLSKILTRAGQRVSQGDVIGLVGSTGLATGPHLHFGMTKNGKWTDPMRIQSPPAEPLSAADRAAFATVKTGALALLPPRPAAVRRAAN